jgi:hypothetical protein
MTEPSEIEALIGEYEEHTGRATDGLVRRLIAALRERDERIVEAVAVGADALRDAEARHAAELARLREALGQADACFEAALVEGWNEALASGDVDLIRDIYNRRIAFARAALTGPKGG